MTKKPPNLDRREGRRLIHQHQPRFNSQGTRSKAYVYVKLTLNERFPRLSIVRSVKDDGGVYIGPVSSTRAARRGRSRRRRPPRLARSAA